MAVRRNVAHIESSEVSLGSNVSSMSATRHMVVLYDASTSVSLGEACSCGICETGHQRLGFD